MPGSKRRFNVNIGFNDDDRILIKNLYIFKGYGEKKLIKVFKDEGWAFKLTEQITELFKNFARLFCIVLPCIT